jgi:hypothetical protein
MSRGKAKQRLTFTPVNRIGEQCACCGRERGPRSVRGVRVVILEDNFTIYYCDVCIRSLEEARKHP